MEYDFYQNIMGKLLHVGKQFVPDGYREWRIPVLPELKIGRMEDILTTSPNTIMGQHIYYKTAIGYIAKVDSKLTK